MRRAVTLLTKFYDTNILLSHLDAVKKEDLFLLSSVTLRELEHIKVGTKSDEVKYEARRATRFLDENPDKYKVVVYDLNSQCDFNDYGLEDSPDNRIMRCAVYARDVLGYSDLVFMTNDILCKLIAKEYFKLNVESISSEHHEIYDGYKDITLSDEEMGGFYSHLNKNCFDCLMNEYLIVRKSDGEIVDTLKWNGTEYKKVCNKTIKSVLFGDKIKPKDIYQSCAIDSILDNTITTLSGKAGSGKSLISLITIMSLIESGKYDRAVIMFNPTKARGASDMGFYSGNATDKALQNSIGSILTTKFGDRFAIDMLLQQDKLRLVSMADIRGMEIRDNEILYITECQNTSIELLKLCLSRASSGCKIIIEGDFDSQVDSYLFDGSTNGMKRAIEILKGDEEFGYVHLPNIWRSKIAMLVDKM